MNQWMMMAMMFGMANRNNAADTVQTVLGASSALGEGGRMAVGLMRQQQVDLDRAIAKKKADDRVKLIGRELHTLSHVIKEQHRLELDLTNFPALEEAVKVAHPDHGPIRPTPEEGAPVPAAAPANNGAQAYNAPVLTPVARAAAPAAAINGARRARR
jgi:hypothetical protein